jgi:hypothetical protein
VFLTGHAEGKVGTDLTNDLLEQYKIYVEMADHVSSRRALANTFFLTSNTTILSVLAFLGQLFLQYTLSGLITGLVVLAGAIWFCTSWFSILNSYDQLNTAKYKVIHDMEVKLPARPYLEEWEKLGNGKDPSKYRPLSEVEKRVPIGFIFMYLILGLTWVATIIVKG